MNNVNIKQHFSDIPGQRAQKPRVLHVVGSLALGGIETWLMHMLRHQDQFEVEHELLLLKENAGPYEAEVRDLGIPINRITIENSKLEWPWLFTSFLRKEGPFLAVHAHCTPHFNAVALMAARIAGVPLRIAHSHEARTRGQDCPTKQRIGTALAKPILRYAATRRIGISEAAIEEIAGTRWTEQRGTMILHYGFDFDAYRGAAERAQKLRARFGIPPTGKVVGTVARFDLVKNHKFLVDAFAHCHASKPTTHLVLVGEGALKTQVERQVAELGLQECVHFAGATQDIAAFMAMFDLFVLPSHSEGLGIVCVEAQAAGTPSIVSTGFPPEVVIIPEGVDLEPISSGPDDWGDKICLALEQAKPDASAWLERVEASRFGLQRCVSELDMIYAAGVAKS